MKTIEIIVDKQGQSRLETKGFEGANCLEASRLLERAIGAITAESNTAEYYSVSSSQTECARE